MKITDKIISIPPYISTSWSKVASLHMYNKELIVTLWDTTRIAIPDLQEEVIKEIFAHHASYLEQQSLKQPPAPRESAELQFTTPLRMLFGTLESLTQALQHNPAYSNIAPLPPEIVSKIETLGKNLPPEELANFLHPIEGCNCMYCQISRILKGEAPKQEETLEITTEDEVREEDLRFEQWDVQPSGDKMYTVTNKLDPNEHYSVFLGDPIGCTCGKASCEHIVAVLRH